MPRIVAVLLAIVAALIAVSSRPALAHSVTVGTLELTDLWTRATPPGAPTAGGYLTITNNGGEDDRLIGVASPIVGRVELHRMEIKDGVMSMHPLEGGIEIPAGESVTLAPGGLHIMFITLQHGLKEGDEMPVTLTFEKAGNVETILHVMAIGSRGPSMEMDGDGAMDHDHMAPTDGGQ